MKVVIIEDSVLASILVEKVLKQIPIITDIQKFENGAEFVKWSEKNKEKNIPDLIITDINMPHLDGMGVLKYTNTNPYLENTKVIVVSAEKSKTTIIECLRLGADNYINKPFNPEKLKAKLATYLIEAKTDEDKLKLLILGMVKDVFNQKYENLKYVDDLYQYKKVEKELLTRITNSFELDNAIQKLSKNKGREI